MTANWFECKIKYTKVTEDGKEKKVSEMYLLDAVSYTEAESRITEALAFYDSGRFLYCRIEKIKYYGIGGVERWERRQVV